MSDTILKELIEKNIKKIEADLIFLESSHTICINEKEDNRSNVKFDILALDKNHTPVIIEAKSITDGSLTYVLEQVGEYLYLLRTKESQSMAALAKRQGIPVDENKLKANKKNSRIIILVEKRENEPINRLKNAIEVFTDSVDIRLYSYRLSTDKTSLEDINLESPKNLSVDKRIIHKSEEAKKLYEELSDLFTKMKQMTTRTSGRGELGLIIGDKLNCYIDITQKNGDQVAADFGLSFQCISFYRRTKLLIDEIQTLIKKDAVAVSLASGILSGLDKQQQKRVFGYMASFLQLNTDQKVINRKKLIRMKKAAIKGEEYDDIKYDLLAK
ncbi:hypothetical protein [Ruminococcus albus]|uniref:Uncharacterized protein n=1 Tax=Ruminococcus albus TaxID=1264 RepID=A0A1I1GX68_RUMAL|nr:hypothetical protein [Ruminococcus albus]SFC14458.1 hypothetical protein SAMN02910406_01216 [Ruminococcus albus]